MYSVQFHPPTQTRPVMNASATMLVVIDTGIECYQSLAASVADDVPKLILDPQQDGIVQLTTTLQHYPNVRHLHIVAPGSPGCLALGNRELSLVTLNWYALHIMSWFLSIDPPCYLSLYSDNLVRGDAGVQFLEQLQHLTGATIATSTNPWQNYPFG